MPRRAVGLSLLALAGFGLAVAPACSPAPRPGEWVEIAGETALIVWDPATKTEHFIRTSSFRSTAPDFGFLVPSPSRPELGEADPAVFTKLAAFTAPKVEERRVQRTRPNPDVRLAGVGAPAPRSGVEVLEQTRVGRYDATVIAFRRAKGEDAAVAAGELEKWLAKNGYPFSPNLVEWVKPYVEQNWVMTAFKVAAGAAGGVADTPVRMSFQTDRPFYPYREPADQRVDPPAPDPKLPPWERTRRERLLRVFLLTTHGAEPPALGDGTSPLTVAWRDTLTPEQLRDLAPAAKLPGGGPTGDLTLTEFEDLSTPRPGTHDLFFEPAAGLPTVHRPPIVREVTEWVDPPPFGLNPELTDRLRVVGLAAGGAALAAALAYLVWLLRRP